mmetsp:Transcript_7887/g.17567  ORF Transcript_7887/g.17567 Transcript_7887/m.17567 type:complete len:108 (-) Transcript_7887:567-890(-)|eukprot:scaffold1653_cov97-Alexandrium_tamarense.AAC.1
MTSLKSGVGEYVCSPPTQFSSSSLTTCTCELRNSVSRLPIDNVFDLSLSRHYCSRSTSVSLRRVMRYSDGSKSLQRNDFTMMYILSTNSNYPLSMQQHRDLWELTSS